MCNAIACAARRYNEIKMINRRTATFGASPPWKQFFKLIRVWFSEIYTQAIYPVKF